MSRQFIQDILSLYPDKGKPAGIPNVPANLQVQVFNARAFNNTGSAKRVGIMRLLAESAVKLFSYDDSAALGNQYTLLDTSNLVANPVNIFSGVVNDGFAIAHPTRIGLVGITVLTFAAGGVFEYRYNRNGTFANFPSTLDLPADYNSIGDKYHAWIPPLDWVVEGETGDGLATLAPNHFVVRVRATTQPGGVVSINDLWSAVFFDTFKLVQPGQTQQITFDWNKPLTLDGGENVIPFFETADPTNVFASFFSTVG